jgi:heptosyltransferase-2
LDINQVKTDCRHYKGTIPCKPNKLENVLCFDGEKDCQYYEKTNKKILIIKLGAIGDVIRTTPLFTRLKEENPTAKFYWLTLTPDVVPQNTDVILKFDFKAVLELESNEFDIAINLDKDKEACSLFDRISAKQKYGFTIKDGMPAPVNQLPF